MKKFKKGDKIVCVDDVIVSQIHPKLILNKTYTVDRLLEDNDIIYQLYQTYGLVLKEHPSYEFYGNRFVLLKEIRKQKLNKLCPIQN